MLRALLLVLVLCGAARAQPKAVSVESSRDPARHHAHGPVGVGVDLSFGWAGQRNGPTGEVRLVFNNMFARFDERAEPHQERLAPQRVR